MKLCVSFLHEGHPELLGVVAVAVERSLALSVVRDPGVDYYVLPLSILEKLKHSKSVLNSVIYYQVL